MPSDSVQWSLKRGGEQWILSYGENREASVALFCRGPLTENAGGDPWRLAENVLGTGKKIPVVAPKQVHGRDVVTVAGKWRLPERPEADALFLEEPGLFGSLRFADCFPVILSGRTPRTWIAIGHSGFAGTGRNVASALASKVSDAFGSEALEYAAAWIGPGICCRCYGRDPDDPWTRWGEKVYPSEYVVLEGNQVHFDLQGAIAEQLAEAGVQEGSLFRIPFCTLCRNDIFYSHRANDRQRNFLLARLLPPGHKECCWWENDISGSGDSFSGE